LNDTDLNLRPVQIGSKGDINLRNKRLGANYSRLNAMARKLRKGLRI
jgi:hypothetical protein